MSAGAIAGKPNLSLSTFETNFYIDASDQIFFVLKFSLQVLSTNANNNIREESIRLDRRSRSLIQK